MLSLAARNLLINLRSFPAGLFLHNQMKIGLLSRPRKKVRIVLRLDGGNNFAPF